MFRIVCFIISSALLLAGIVSAIILSKMKYKSKRFLTPTKTFSAGVFASSFAMFLPTYSELFENEFLSFIKTFFFSLHSTIRLFVVDINFETVSESIASLDGWLREAYFFLSCVLLILAPVLTFGFILSFFKNVSSYKKYFVKFFSDTYVFSELSEKSIALASDICRGNSGAVIVFTDVFETNSEQSYELIEKAKELGAICFKKDIISVNFKLHSRKAKLAFFTIAEDETENINQALKLLKSYQNRKLTDLYAFSSKTSGKLLLTKAEKKNLKVRRIDPIKSLINRTLYDNGEELFTSARQSDKNNDLMIISVVIVGLGQHGTEMLKALSWLCQMDGYELNIDAFDSDEKAESRLYSSCPQLLDSDFNGQRRKGEPYYNIKIHSGVEFGTAEFDSEINKLKNTTFIFVSLGDDEKNIEAAIYLRMLYCRMESMPVIKSIVYDSGKKKALKNIENFKGATYEIDYIGDINSSYSQQVIINSGLESDALLFHLRWNPDKEEEFWNYEYNYSSSIASAIHQKVHMDLDRIKNAELEHRRWSAYMRSIGYINGREDPKKGKSKEEIKSCKEEINRYIARMHLAKMHYSLKSFDELSDDDIQKNVRIVSGSDKSAAENAKESQSTSSGNHKKS